MTLDVGFSKERRFFIFLGLAYSGLYVATGLQDLSIAHDSAVYLASAAAGEATIHPNHLLYGPLAAAVVKCFQAIGLSAHRALTTIDGLAGGLVMALVALILVRRGNLRPTDAALASMPIGLSFGVWFYSAGIEIYLPALVPLLGGLYILSGPMKDRRAWAVAGALHGISTLMHQSHILFATVPILSAALSEGSGRQKLGRLAIYVAVGAALVGPAYLLAALAVGVGPDLPALFGWAAGYAGTGNSYWATPPSNFMKAATGFARSQVGGFFVFAVPQLSSVIASVFPVEPWDGPFLVRSMSAGVGLAMAATAALAALMAAAALVAAAGRAQQLLDGGPRRLTILLLAAIVPYSAFFSFWQPHNPEFWIAQSIFIWLAIGVSLLGPGRRARTGARLVGAVGALYGVVTLTSAIIPAMDVQNDYFWRLLDSAPKGSVPSVVVVDHFFPLNAYARLAGYPLVLSADMASDDAVSVALQHLTEGQVVLLAAATSEEAAGLSGRLPATFVRTFSEDGRTVRIEPRQ